MMPLRKFEYEEIGERTITQLASGKDPSQVEGLYYWEKGKPKKSNPDLNELFKQKV